MFKRRDIRFLVDFFSPDSVAPPKIPGRIELALELDSQLVNLQELSFCQCPEEPRGAQPVSSLLFSLHLADIDLAMAPSTSGHAPTLEKFLKSLKGQSLEASIESLIA